MLQLPPSLSLPSTPHSFASRAARVNDALMHRLARTSRLNKYMQVMKNKCLWHFIAKAQLVLESNHSCSEMQRVSMDQYYVFKRNFSFAPFTYCFHCGLPQSKNHNGEEPACHAGFIFRKGVVCPFAGFIFKAIFCIWNIEGFRRLMCWDLGVERNLSTIDEFMV